MAAPDSIKTLVEEFERLKGGPTPDSFDEAQLCTSYIEPFWKALGWNVRDPREVVKEKRVRLRASTKHADFCFQLKGKPQFVLEAKDFRKKIDDADFIFQTKRYGYNLPVDFGILTNFAEFRLYDTGLQPVYENKARGLFKPYLLEYSEYVDKWDELAAVFSREAVAAGVLRELLPRARRTRNKEALDRTFFEGLNEWRAELARVIALRNGDVGVHDINEAVQRILDRCIFMRVIEDREIEAVELLLDALNRWEREREKPLYRYMVDKFRYLEPQYNGELFEPHFSEDLIVDDKPLRDFVKSLYYPECPYQFNVVGVEMLGTIYERFLGSTIRLTKSHRAVVEEKPEVRKAGGVYYTPKYIVDYIVENTVGELLRKCKTPAAAAKLKILDPACGSGSFLLGAFQRLIDWHEDYFNANPDKIGKGLAASCWWDGDEGKHRLTAKYKGQILVNNIFGVDIDPQACEVTRMSLYLKVLEDVDAQSLLKAALLPPLDANIKCGNSLIGSDYFEGQLMPSEEERRRVNPFDWEVEFEGIMKAGGFDAVIGNPPYVRIHNIGSEERDYYLFKYVTPKGQFDLYQLFYEKGLELLKPSGTFGMITSNKFAITQYGRKLREFLRKGFKITQIVDVSHEKVFFGPSTYPFILIIKNELPQRGSVTTVLKGEEGRIFKTYEGKQNTVCPEDGSPFDIYGDTILRKVEEKGEKALKVKRGKPTAKSLIGKEREGYIRGLTNKEVQKYHILYVDQFLNREDTFLVKPSDIVMKKICYSINATIPNEDVGAVNTVYIIDSGFMNSCYVLGILNSTLFKYYVRRKYAATSMRGGYIEMRVFEIETLPIIGIIDNDPADVARHDKMVALVEEMLELNKRLAAAKSDADKQRLQRAVAATDRKIDTLVYELYGLTDEEIRIVEGTSGPQ